MRGEGTNSFNTNSFAVGSSLKFFIALENKRENKKDIHERLCTTIIISIYTVGKDIDIKGTSLL